MELAFSPNRQDGEGGAEVTIEILIYRGSLAALGMTLRPFDFAQGKLLRASHHYTGLHRIFGFLGPMGIEEVGFFVDVVNFHGIIKL